METQPTDKPPVDDTATDPSTEAAPGAPSEPTAIEPELAPPLADLIASIRTAVGRGASAEARAAGAFACRSLLAVLEAAPGQPIGTPAPTAPSPVASFAAMFTQPGFLTQLAAMSREQLLELLRQFTGANAAKPPGPTTAAPRFHLIEIPNTPRPGGRR